MSYDNTVGSRSSITKTNLAYIAGFLDGDGSLMLQLKRRGDSSRGVRFMATVCFYQDSRHETPLLWIRRIVGCGYVSKRKDGITEFRINGFLQVRKTVGELLPYLRFKKKQASLLYKACLLLEQKTIRTMTTKDMRNVIELLVGIQQENYMSTTRKTKEDLYVMLGLTP